MALHPRIETPDTPCLCTSRTRNSELWFVNNERLHDAILGYLAKYTDTYQATLYAFAIEGNHLHTDILFPQENRSGFMRAFNSQVARSVQRLVPEFPGGSVLGRRYSNEILPDGADLEEYFFYVALQPVQDGQVEFIRDFDGYHFFHDAVYGIEREFKVVDYKRFNAARKKNPGALLLDFITTYTLKYERLPGYEHLSQKDYAKLMYKKLEKRRLKIVADRRAAGLGFAGRVRRSLVIPGSRPFSTKRSSRHSHRPRVLSVCPIRRAEWLRWYFEIYDQYKAASKLFRAGFLDTVFPSGTYRPWTKYSAAQLTAPN
ncbi:MAG: hypothetical protein IT290_06945 [Deltaproteobacteria bacterium]|nr:hypothetical protein [Deltaproteobacteria bacterium]